MHAEVQHLPINILSWEPSACVAGAYIDSILVMQNLQFWNSVPVNDDVNFSFAGWTIDQDTNKAQYVTIVTLLKGQATNNRTRNHLLIASQQNGFENFTWFVGGVWQAGQLDFSLQPKAGNGHCICYTSKTSMWYKAILHPVACPVQNEYQYGKRFRVKVLLHCHNQLALIMEYFSVCHSCQTGHS